jgi:hypothetical protein
MEIGSREAVLLPSLFTGRSRQREFGNNLIVENTVVGRELQHRDMLEVTPRHTQLLGWLRSRFQHCHHMNYDETASCGARDRQQTQKIRQLFARIAGPVGL